METTAKYKVKENTWPAKTFVTKRARIGFDKLTAFFGESYDAIYGAIQKSGLQVNEPPCAIFYSKDEVKKKADLAAAVPVQGLIPENIEFEKIVIPKSKVLTTTYYGPYENMKPAYEVLEKYMIAHGLKRELIIEEYFSDPAEEKDEGKWKTKIHFIVR